MSPEEKNVIAGIFDRLAEVADQPRDPEAERLIAERVRAQPYAPYAMAQTIHIQEQALSNLQQEVEALRAEIEEASRRQRQSSGILGALFGGGAAPPRETPPGGPWGSRGAPDPRWGGVPAAGPWQQPMQPPMPQGGGFLSGALTTALGVAGGVMIANAVSNAFAHGGASSRLSEGVGQPGGTRLFSEDGKVGRDEATDWRDAATDVGSSFDRSDFDIGDFGGGD